MNVRRSREHLDRGPGTKSHDQAQVIDEIMCLNASATVSPDSTHAKITQDHQPVASRDANMLELTSPGPNLLIQEHDESLSSKEASHYLIHRNDKPTTASRAARRLRMAVKRITDIRNSNDTTRLQQLTLTEKVFENIKKSSSRSLKGSSATRSSYCKKSTDGNESTEIHYRNRLVPPNTLSLPTTDNPLDKLIYASAKRALERDRMASSTHWYCSECAEGPWLDACTISRPNCYHIKCAHCKWVAMYPDGSIHGNNVGGDSANTLAASAHRDYPQLGVDSAEFKHQAIDIEDSDDDNGSTVSRSLGSDNDGAVRFRMRSDVPQTIKLDGDMDGRTIQLLPAENGMIEVVIGSKGRGGKSNYQNETRSVRGERRAIASASQARRDAEEMTERSSTRASSVFSLASRQTVATDLSRASGYSMQEIAIATRELVNILHGDEALVALYHTTLRLPGIGAERLQHNLRRVFKAYAEHLKEESRGQLQFLASRLVSLNARYLAQCIVSKYDIRPTGIVQGESVDPPDASSGDEGAEERPFDESIFEDLVSFRQFLVESEAFKTLHIQLRNLISPRQRELAFRQQVSWTPDVVIPRRSWRTWHADVRCLLDSAFTDPLDYLIVQRAQFACVDAFYLAMDTLFIFLGLLEPPLTQNATRLRWTNRSGSNMFSDVVEYRYGGIAQLLPQLERSTGAKVTAASYIRPDGNQHYRTPRPFQWIQSGFAKLSVNTSRPTGPCIPLHNNSGAAAPAPTSTTTTTTSPSAPSVPQSALYLLACMHRDRLRKILQQDPLNNVNTDRELFRFMQQQHVRHRGRFRNMLSFKHVTGIFFVKFNLPPGEIVIVRDHKSHCAVNAAQIDCQCIPPVDFVEPSQHAQYRCVPGPPEVYPPIPSNHLAQLFSHPEDAHEEDDWILKQLPRRTRGKLEGQPGRPAEGWGVYYQEDWDYDLISALVFLVILVASVVFGALWSVFKFDVQGAFGVSSYMVAVCATLIPLIAMWVDKPR